MSQLITEPDELRRRLKTLQKEMRGRKHLEEAQRGELVEALAEGSFRLAIHPWTPSNEAFDLLYQAMRLDGTNPKFAYHLARLYFVYGQFELAASWLQRARKLAPTSHRIWAHISLLQNELNAIYRGNDKYVPDALRKRSEAIAQAINAGKDEIHPALADFTPPLAQGTVEKIPGAAREQDPGPAQAASPDFPITSTRRLTAPGQNRWSGIIDLSAEWLLEGEPTEAKLDKLLPLLTMIAARKRSGGVAAFAILGIEWIISRYPIACVRELRNQKFAGMNGPALQLLDRVCELYEADEKDLSTMLAEAVEKKQIPPVLAALIHQRQLLWTPYEYRGLSAYHSAKKFLRATQGTGSANGATSQEQDQTIDSYVRQLQNALVELHPKRPPELEVKTQGNLASVHDLEHQVEEFRVDLGVRWDRLKGLLTLKKADQLTETLIIEGAQIAGDVEMAFKTCDESIQTIQQIRSRGDIAVDEVMHLDQVEKQFLELLAQQGKFRKNLTQLPEPPANFSQPETQKAAEPLAGIKLLEARIEETESAIETLFQEANVTFAPYSEQAQQLPPLHALRMNIHAQEAETYYRLGWHSKARRVWNAMLTDDRLDARIMKNIALCDSRKTDPLAPLFAWKSYVELLYLYDIVEGSPRPNARQRADFHRTIGDAYGPPKLMEELDSNWLKSLAENKAEFLAFWASPSRVRNYVNHKLLEFLNSKLDFKSPLLILGVTRSEGIHVPGGIGALADKEARRNAALASETLHKLLAFTASTTKTLPMNVRQGFQALCSKHAENAAIQCAIPERVSARRDKDYDDEDPRQLKWVEDIIRLKYKFFALSNNEELISELAQHMTSVDWLGELLRLDSVPVDLSEATVQKAIMRLNVQNPPDFVNLMELFGQMVIIHLLLFVITEEENISLAPLRKQQYHRLVTEWVKHPVLKPYLDLIDDPHFIYNSGTVKIESLHQRYPELGGPAKGLAIQLMNENQCQKAIQVLDVALQKGFNKAGHPTIYLIRMQAWFILAQQAKDQLDTMHLLQKTCQDAENVLQQSQVEKEKTDALVCHTHAYQNLATVYRKANRYDEAIQALKSVHMEKLEADQQADIFCLQAITHYEHVATIFQSRSQITTQTELDRLRSEIKRKLEQARDDAKRAIDIARDKSSKTITTANDLYADILKQLAAF